MNPWKPFPLIRLLIPFLAGVICALLRKEWQPDDIRLIGISGFLTVLLLVQTVFGKLLFSLRWVPGLIICLLMCCLGILTVGSTQLAIGSGQLAIDSCKLQAANCRLFPAEIVEPPRLTTRSVKLIVNRYEPDTATNSLIRCGKALLFLEKDTRALELQYGDRILVSTTLKPVKDESNPYGFDPASFYGRKGVFYQGWVDSTEWSRIRLQAGNSLKRFAFGLRDRLLNILRENSLEGEEFAVASAILLGYTGEIGKELRKGFAASGAMHILAVSGMHVGIIFLFLETMLSFLNKRNHGPKIKAMLMILMIWSYAMITGLSPPVFRAALMLSLIIAGRTFKRKPESLNVICGSMFVILLMDPTLVLHLGFQFSYLAVFGILFLYKPLVNLIPVTGWLLSRVWGLVAVSIAAQIATFPIALYAFHQFPNYFILTNIAVLPLASLVIYSGIGVLALSPIPALSLLVAKALSFIVWLLNGIIRFIEGIPGSTTTGIYPSLPDTLFLYLAIIAICSYIISRKALWVQMFLILLAFWSCSGIFQEYLRTNRSLVLISHVKGASQYIFVNGRDEVVMKDIKSACQIPYAQEILSTFHAAEKITNLQTTYLDDNCSQSGSTFHESGFLVRKGNYLQFSEVKIAIISSAFPLSLTDSLPVDLVIIRKNPELTIEQVRNAFHPKQIILDPTNSWYNANRWKKQAEELGIPCYSVLEEGAYVLDTRCQMPDARCLMPDAGNQMPDAGYRIVSRESRIMYRGSLQSADWLGQSK